MLNQLLYLSTDCKDKKPFGENVNLKGTGAVILKTALIELEKQHKVKFSLKNKDEWTDELFATVGTKKYKMSKVDGCTSVYDIRLIVNRRIPNIKKRFKKS